MQEVMLYVGSVIIILWGVAHIAIPTKGIIRGFGPISEDNRRILAMEWIMEGLTLIFIGLLVIAITAIEGIANPVSVLVYRISGVMLVAMAIVSSFTGARASILPMKLCPPIFTTVAIAYWIASA